MKKLEHREIKELESILIMISLFCTHPHICSTAISQVSQYVVVREMKTIGVHMFSVFSDHVLSIKVSYPLFRVCVCFLRCGASLL